LPGACGRNYAEADLELSVPMVNRMIKEISGKKNPSTVHRF
jgi:hypothetical protein